MYAFSFDLQKALPFPILTCSTAYYKRNMYVYNLGCHDLSTNSGYMYVWNEITASRGSQEIASCVIEHLRNRSSAKHLEHVVMFSDSCGGQNRNIKMSLAVMHHIQSAESTIKTVDHKFMVSGHSFLPNDADFGVVERFVHGKTIYVPEDWYNAILKSKRKKPYVVKVMDQTEMFSTNSLEKSITRRKKNEQNDKVSWFNIQWLRYVKEQPFQIFYKESLNDDLPFLTLNIAPAKKGGRLTNLNRVLIEPLFSSPQKVTALKKRDMMDLLKFIPPVHHGFFNSLTDGTDNDDNPIVNRESEAEEDDD
uniref:Uncharacterized protein n=1 Tax=Graphocephala atropunctata TaxID=36148 RepID=A0A1B6KFA9_9HEMI